VSLREGLNVRSTFRFNAFMTPIRANIVGPPSIVKVLKERGYGTEATAPLREAVGAFSGDDDPAELAIARQILTAT
jgi:hypothetical protein